MTRATKIKDRQIAELTATLASYDSNAQSARCKVPEGQTPLNDKLGHRYLDVIQEGATARDTGAGSPYHGHSLEHCLHAAGWVQRDLRLALDKAYDSNALDPATVEALIEAESDGWERGMLEAANICGSLAETTYDDSDSFEAATGCEAFIRANMFAHKNARIRAGAKQ